MTGRFNQLETSNFDISHWFSFFGRGLIFLAFSYQFSSYLLNEPDFISSHLKQKLLAAMYFAVFISNQSTMQILLSIALQSVMNVKLIQQRFRPCIPCNPLCQFSVCFPLLWLLGPWNHFDGPVPMAGPKSLQAELGIVNDSLESCVMIYYFNCDMVDSRAALCLIHRNANMWAVYVRYLTSNKK